MSNNRERQQKLRSTRLQSGMSRLEVWISDSDKQCLDRLMEVMKESGNFDAGYAVVISRALKEMEINLTPAGGRNVVRYGLLYLNNDSETVR
ncbi:MAG: hypothetical protein PHH11_11435 [Methylomonas sp.]|nr:hypothetical protein [Methylomonas sp.]